MTLNTLPHSPGLLAYAFGRCLGAVLTVVALSFVTFAVMTWLPGDPLAVFESQERGRALNEARRAALASEWNLAAPLHVRYGHWLTGALRGDLGRSLRTRRPVIDELTHRLGPTLELSLGATLLALVTSLPLGWWLARRRRSLVDRSALVGLVALYALPVFWLAMLLQALLAVRWGLVPLYGRLPAGGAADLGTRLHHLALPATCLALHQLAFYARFARNTAAEGLDSIQTLFARACGLGETRIVWRHGILPSLVALVTLAGLVLPSLVTGAVLIETLFAWPGMGRLFVVAIQARDFPVVLAMTVMIGSLTVAGSLLADLGGRLADPRLRVGGSQP
ncbi:MAG: ABC transporter permease [Acidobacteriota bacterium]|nr:ABC transporter permease [Acidobacteriota bacterium]